MDEATSALDNETEAAIQKSLEYITANRTTVANDFRRASFAHRLSTIRYADCIYVMEQGKIVEQGKHEELLELGGIYTQLWNVQTGQRE